jgi:hypothetical protein
MMLMIRLMMVMMMMIVVIISDRLQQGAKATCAGGPLQLRSGMTTS